MKRALLITLLLTALLTGCMNSVRLNDRGVVEAVAVDRTEEGLYTAVLQLAGQTQDGDKPPASSELLQEGGGTLTDLFSRAAVKRGKSLFFGSCRLILIGEDAAREGVNEVLDFFNANHQITPAVTVAVVKDKAENLLMAQEKDPALTADRILDIIQNARQNGFAPESRLMDLVGAIHSDYSSGTLALVELSGETAAASSSESQGGSSREDPSKAQETFLPNGEKTDTPDTKSDQKESGKPEIQLAGSAVFSGDRLVHLLNPQQTRGLAWVKGKIKNTALSVADENLGIVAAVTNRVKARVIPERMGDTLVFHIAVEVHSGAYETVLNTGDRMTAEQKRYAAALQARDIRREIESAIHATQGQGYDPLGLTQLVKQRLPEYYQEHASDWETVFTGCGYNVVVGCEIDRSGGDNKLL